MCPIGIFISKDVRIFQASKDSFQGYIWCYFLGTNSLKFKCGFLSAGVAFMSEVKSKAVYNFLNHFWSIEKRDSGKKAFGGIKDILRTAKI